MQRVGVTAADIKRLKAEKQRELDAKQRAVEALRHDLEALERIEAMLNGQPLATPRRKVIESSSRTQLRDLVLGILAKSEPLLPREIVELAIKQGYKFATPRSALGSITSVLSRKKGKGVHKLPDGRWMAERVT
jgi:hypothetical protein